uniref:Uncharacterized protein n=1 Tax=Chlamydomonas leiostraca TaxID=1034604 RepID=A0A7S0RE69_9CHLO|mmetsp:Transcript_20624/g.52338  ORF Transcript_20624/g.52338 Transcript_20624/m.52338 type:complete len:237 (+) Transcript_20624:241-951(+)
MGCLQQGRLGGGSLLRAFLQSMSGPLAASRARCYCAQVQLAGALAEVHAAVLPRAASTAAGTDVLLAAIALGRFRVVVTMQQALDAVPATHSGVSEALSRGGYHPFARHLADAYLRCSPLSLPVLAAAQVAHAGTYLQRSRSRSRSSQQHQGGGLLTATAWCRKDWQQITGSGLLNLAQTTMAVMRGLTEGEIELGWGHGCLGNSSALELAARALHHPSINSSSHGSWWQHRHARN